MTSATSQRNTLMTPNSTGVCRLRGNSGLFTGNRFARNTWTSGGQSESKMGARK